MLKLHPVVLLEALCGGQTVAATLSAANEEVGRFTTSVGFGITHGISNLHVATATGHRRLSPSNAN